MAKADPAEQSRSRRERILDAAFHAFSVRGYRDTAVDDIAGAADRLFRREDSLLFNKKHLYRAHEFYARHGGKTVVIARFMPIVRTFVPVVAGMGRMDYRRYTLYNVIGGLGWIWGMLFIGYFLGRYIPGIDRHIETVIALVILLSLLPGIIGWLRARRR